MRRKLLLVLLLALFAVSFLRVNIQEAKATTSVYYPDADTYTSGVLPDTNYGTAVSLAIGDDQPGDPDRAWFRFNMTIPNNVTIWYAVFSIYCNGGIYTDDPDPVKVHHCTNDTWVETTITHNNAPSYNATVETQTNYTAPLAGWYEFDILNLTSREYDDGNDTITIVLENDGNYVDWYGHVTKEYTGTDYDPYLTVKYYAYQYTFHGLYDEVSGELESGGVNVTAYFSGNNSETFEVNGTYVFNCTQVPLYFRSELGAKDREYWLSTTEDMATIYVFNQSLTTYTIEFLDLAGVLEDRPFINIQRYVNGTLRTVEKRKVDLEKKIEANLIQGQKYSLVISDSDDLTYTFGDLLFTDEIEVTLTLKGIEFPQNIILGYQYVRIYSYRHDNLSSISICYEDLRTATNNVVIYIKYENGTLAYNTTQSSNSFNVTWSNAQFNLTYYVQSTINHVEFGEMHYNLLLHGGYAEGSPWSFPIGTIPYMNIANLLPIGLILAGAVIFSKINAPVGAFVGCIFAILMYWWGWIVPPDPEVYVGLLVAGMFFSILFGIAHSKKKVHEP